MTEEGATWTDVTDYFSEEQRHYKNVYLEIDEVLDETVELSLFSSEVDDFEIYFNFGIFHGIVYADGREAYNIRNAMKAELEEEYHTHGEPTDDFINAFCEKFKVALPTDIYFDADPLFEI